MKESVHLSTPDRVIAALLLTSVAGFVDAIGWITLIEVFTANMSGNTIHIGMGLGRLDFSAVSHFACSICTYVLALILTRITLEVGGRARILRIASFTLTLEAVLLLVFANIAPPLQAGHVPDQNSPLYFAMVAMLAFAMGVQTGTLTHLGPLTVYTTFVTGTLTKFSESLARTIFWIYDTLKDGQPLFQVLGGLCRQTDALASVFLLATWICYVIGAALGTATKARWELRALYFPVAALACLVLLDVLRPIAAIEIREQATTPHPTAE
jgi:uncharacterized membrane protein YoaK (UPF0700 family)